MQTLAQVDRELSAYRRKLLALSDRYLGGERSFVAAEAESCADALICLMEEAPIEVREKIDYLIDRFETLHRKCLS